MNQADFAALAEVTKKTQMLYESDKRSPKADYLAAAATAGVDVLYVLTGQRSTSETGLAQDEAALLDNYRKTSPERRASLEEVGRAFASSTEKNHKTTSA
ncbi:transcriptional regulator [Pistricoccus aurantiacus]|uniref:transcriptional regulator n=1 Tax=Pistricoccus aurantiacus TaxID=1883414 RepID=UPI001647FABB|nr:transcriptional regulator [Pistricoccus aurantiacus]